MAGAPYVVDGDTIAIGKDRIRLFGIDAPELRQTCQVGYSNWRCGEDAASALRTIIGNQRVRCEPRDKDVYGRTVAECRAGGVDVAEAMLTKGFAITLSNASASYTARERDSKIQRIGIWASKFDTPADYRAANPSYAANDSGSSSPSGGHVVPLRQTTRRSSSGPIYWSCAQARAAGAAPMYSGQAAYNPNLDGDGDGIACEPYRGRRQGPIRKRR